MHYILTRQQRDQLLELRREFSGVLQERHMDINPVELKDGTFIVPVEVARDPKYADLLSILQQRNLLQDLPVRLVSEDEIPNTIKPKQ